MVYSQRAHLKTLTDSSDILKYASSFATPEHTLYPASLAGEVDKWETLFNNRLGKAVRVVAYYHLLADPIIHRIMGDRVGPTERAIGRAILPLLRVAMRKRAATEAEESNKQPIFSLP